MNLMLWTWSRVLVCAALLAGFSAVAGDAVAAPGKLSGVPTPLKGNSQWIISLRHQYHMWDAADGSTYLVLNRGTYGGSDGLQIVSSPDHGLSWYPGPRLPGSDRNSTSDGYVDNDVLYLTYTNTAGEVVFAALKQSRTAAVGTWTVVGSETAFSSPDTIAINPAMAIDSAGVLWLAFVGQDVATGNYAIRMLRNSSPAEGWVDTGFTFGDIDNLSIERSARPVPTATGMGMVYSVHEQLFWASRENAWDAAHPWTRQLLFTSTAGDNDPYASHFSVVADAQKAIHMSISDGGRVRYFRRDAATKAWTAKWISGDISAGYVQTSIVGGNVVVASNTSTNIVISLSCDGGTSFTIPYTLVRPPEGISTPYPRIETAGHTVGPMLLLQQYVDNNLQRLQLFSVPLP